MHTRCTWEHTNGLFVLYTGFHFLACEYVHRDTNSRIRLYIYVYRMDRWMDASGTKHENDSAKTVSTRNYMPFAARARAIMIKAMLSISLVVISLPSPIIYTSKRTFFVSNFSPSTMRLAQPARGSWIHCIQNVGVRCALR